MNVCMVIRYKEADVEDSMQTRSEKASKQSSMLPDTPHDTDNDDDDDDDDDDDIGDEELVLRILRDPCVGLGISIAGGIGTTAFKDGDEVTCSVYSMNPIINISITIYVTVNRLIFCGVLLLLPYGGCTSWLCTGNDGRKWT